MSKIVRMCQAIPYLDRLSLPRVVVNSARKSLLNSSLNRPQKAPLHVWAYSNTFICSVHVYTLRDNFVPPNLLQIQIQQLQILWSWLQQNWTHIALYCTLCHSTDLHLAKVEWVVRFGWIVGPLPWILVTGPGLHLLFLVQDLDTSIQINHCKSKVHCFFRLSFIITFHKKHQVPVKCMSIIGIFFVPAMIENRQVERWVFLFELIVST